MKVLKYAAFACMMFIGLNAQAGNMTDKMMMKATPVTSAEFVKRGSMANLFEIKTSQLALEKSKNNDVREFAQQMVNDHTKAGQDMKVALRRSSVKSSVAAMALDKPHQDVYNKLAGMQGQMFDEEYIKVQNDAHKQAVSLFNLYSLTGKDKSLKAFATNTLPTLKMHQDHVKPLYESLMHNEQNGKM